MMKSETTRMLTSRLLCYYRLVVAAPYDFMIWGGDAYGSLVHGDLYSGQTTGLFYDIAGSSNPLPPEEIEYLRELVDIVIEESGLDSIESVSITLNVQESSIHLNFSYLDSEDSQFEGTLL